MLHPVFDIDGFLCIYEFGLLCPQQLARFLHVGPQAGYLFSAPRFDIPLSLLIPQRRRAGVLACREGPLNPRIFPRQFAHSPAFFVELCLHERGP